ncbi:MAG: hypothetical protein COV46_07115 [Deltaproteobacteria bacterium CG11_big_fil_rev_8_21_14_0_20_49_13]|nr:MAG: hypothetical protein COV46_07115 [Deltaproteobacteria bacterium CG11_big_fil_rev_8_21_14_0_20_49_13]
MAEFERPEETELVDVSEVSEMLPEEYGPGGKVHEMDDEPYLEARATVATLRERFAEFLIDSTVLFYLYFLIGIIARRAFYGSWSGPLPFYGWQGLAFNGSFFFAAFMYYFIFESVFFATPGKFCAWMYVRQKNGEFPAMASIFIRNVFRLLDYLLPFIPFFCMELTRKHQRLGDFVAGTTVIKKHGIKETQYSITMANIASASGRVVSALLDLSLAGAATFGYLLLLSPDHPETSKWLLLFTPLVPLMFYVITESLTGTTPGKWLFGYAITQEDGTSVPLSGSLVRTFLAIFELNPLGLLVIWLSPKHQRIGDLAADTLVTEQKRRWPGGAALVAWILLSSFIFMLGWNNENNFLKPSFKFNFYPTFEFMGSYADESAYKELTITHIRFAVNGPDTIRTPSVFQSGENVFIISDIYGYERSGRMVWLQEDLDVRYPDGSIGLHQENIVDYHQVIETRGAVELTNSLKLPSDAKDGTYTVTITVRDLFGHEYKMIKTTFDVKTPSVPPS